MALPDYFTKPDSIKSKANKREAKVFKHLASGALAGFKGDFSSQDCLFDNKSTDKKSIHITETMLKKLISDTLTMGKEHAILILDLPHYYVVCKATEKRE